MCKGLAEFPAIKGISEHASTSFTLLLLPQCLWSRKCVPESQQQDQHHSGAFQEWKFLDSTLTYWLRNSEGTAPPPTVSWPLQRIFMCTKFWEAVFHIFLISLSGSRSLFRHFCSIPEIIKHLLLAELGIEWIAISWALVWLIITWVF